MLLQKTPPLHLTYCLNIHPGETWAENFSAIRTKALAVRAKVAPDQPFGLGLRLGYAAACELKAPSVRETFRDFLTQNRVYVFTVNGFPYGQFHGTKVKERVYQPDWRFTQRRDYTLQLIDILADILPPDIQGSISTVPCSFKPCITRHSEVDQMMKMLMDCVIHMATLHEEHGKEIHLGLEPEPGCYLESTPEVVAFFNDVIFTAGRNYVQKQIKCGITHAESIIRRHLGICLDTCHLAIQFEDLKKSLTRYRSEGIRISKVQLGAALEIKVNSKSTQILKPFCEEVYLHQVKAQLHNGTLLSWNDLPPALKEIPSNHECKRVRVHFHIPLFFKGSRNLGTTATCLTQEFFELLKAGASQHLEIETYTFDVLPKELRPDNIVDSIVKEFEWVNSEASR